MKKYTFKHVFLFVFIFFGMAFNHVFAHSTITYAYPFSPYDLNQCKLKATKALNKSGYNIYSPKDAMFIAGTKGEFRTLIVCDTAVKSGIAFIIVNGNKANPDSEMKIVNRNFKQEK